ncbi:hypothetical protein [Geomesophilobacter sediminis]|uniref:Uncharacterized protein n=1 Tax=Geomesophilobacter sediminis TaxID=2798584 RepID=A0A8J7IPY4_9BACT|nr:hypothetical protein [Geomesophilobacter sediminis]MBJ6724564.1 hypothetical protein [Geomesophilobacter sediminis]
MERIGDCTILRNEDVTGVIAEIPEGHRHLRTTVTLADGSSFTFQEATIAAIARAYLTVKTDPLRTRVELAGTELASAKPGYAAWQLMEV